MFVSKISRRINFLLFIQKTKGDINDAFNDYFRMESRRTKKTNFSSEKCIPVTNIFPLKNKYFGINATIVRGDVEVQRFLKNSRTGAYIQSRRVTGSTL